MNLSALKSHYNVFEKKLNSFSGQPAVLNPIGQIHNDMKSVSPFLKSGIGFNDYELFHIKSIILPDLMIASLSLWDESFVFVDGGYSNNMSVKEATTKRQEMDSNWPESSSDTSLSDDYKIRFVLFELLYSPILSNSSKNNFPQNESVNSSQNLFQLLLTSCLRLGYLTQQDITTSYLRRAGELLAGYEIQRDIQANAGSLQNSSTQ